MSIKKQYVELVELLEQNSSKKVSTILGQIKEMCESKVQSKTFVKNADGDVVAIFCYYHKQWELISEVQYGNKKSSTTGLNTMCKLGVKGWTKTQTSLKKLDAELLTKVMNSEIETEDLASFKEERIAEIKQSVFHDCSHEEDKYTTLEQINDLYQIEN